MKKTLFSAICLLLVLSMALAACNSGAPAPATEGSAPAATSAPAENVADTPGDAAPATERSFPLIEEKITLTAFSREASWGVTDFVDNEFTKYYEDLTNVAIDWNLAPDAEVTTRLNLMLTSGDYPDLNLDPWVLTSTMTALYGSQGVFIPLNDMIEQYGIGVKAALEEMPAMRGLITQADGNIYALPSIDDVYSGKFGSRMWLYGPWLEALDLDVPNTTEELYTVLKAFKEGDPNGNGQADELALIGSIGGVTPVFFHYFTSPFIAMTGEDTDKMYYVDNDVLVPVFNKPEFKESILYLKRLYDEGLLAPESFTQDATALQQWNAGEEVLIGAFPAGSPWNAFSGAYADDRWPDYVVVPPLEGPNGVRYTKYDPYGSIGTPNTVAISSTCEYPEVAFKWADALYDQEMTLRKYYGPPETAWRYAEEGEIGVNGLPAIWATLAVNGGEVDQPNTGSWMHIGLHNRTDAFRLGQAVPGDPTRHGESVLYKAVKENYEPYTPDINTVLPPLTFDEAQAAEISDLSTVIGNYVKESYVRFITGDMNIDTEWETYLTTLEEMNLARFTEILQTCYDAKWKGVR